MSKIKTPFEHTFILLLLSLAIISLIWLFSPFIPALFFALLITIATFDKYQKLKNKTSTTKAALIMTFLITAIITMPIGYILLFSSFKISILIEQINSNFTTPEIYQIFNQVINKLPLTNELKNNAISLLNDNVTDLFTIAKDFSITILKSIIELSSNFILFLIITIFSMYYFYLDGQNIVNRIKNTLPLENKLVNILLNQFSSLAITLITSIFIIALLQGIVFSITSLIIGLPAIYFGISMALASFIPVLGSAIVWLPLSIYLYAKGQIINVFIVLFFGIVIISFIIDNIIRPIVIKKLSQSFAIDALNHTLITVLSTLAGIIQFGILGLLIGPIIAAMAITIFDVYTMKYTK